MVDGRLRIALIHEVFFGDGATERLDAALAEARSEGAELAILPELPLDPWIPATREVRDEDAEPRDGPHRRALCGAAVRAGIGVLGGVIVAENGARRNRALLIDAQGAVVSRYDKLHIPLEPGFWERDHYEPGEALTPPCDCFGLRIGLQICSDVQRPQSSTALAAMGAEVLFAPRATPPGSYDRWVTVLRAAAIATACYVVSTNRPREEHGVAIGGPSVVIAPDGTVIIETEQPVTQATLERAAVTAARADYPGYLDVRADLYGKIWSSLSP
ncbi:MAG: hypothetical protein GTN89_07195 [Acidobacteria bacterium]|nr:hypothetical protein [Acidobacteriota bacterium]NIM62959.1 hypothetical protein [Acidobacteriota bacterium]NIO59113.1 hypothetical protein [Acidobacteriota bacterium]NIQ30144.1 hypothetical protein [Acidobacteriota bacterium]NIQ84982.1 hypothetical protein [Acidobacteriota bacterium]